MSFATAGLFTTCRTTACRSACGVSATPAVVTRAAAGRAAGTAPSAGMDTVPSVARSSAALPRDEYRIVVLPPGTSPTHRAFKAFFALPFFPRPQALKPRFGILHLLHNR